MRRGVLVLALAATAVVAPHPGAGAAFRFAAGAAEVPAGSGTILGIAGTNAGVAVMTYGTLALECVEFERTADGTDIMYGRALSSPIQTTYVVIHDRKTITDEAVVATFYGIAETGIPGDRCNAGWLTLEPVGAGDYVIGP